MLGVSSRGMQIAGANAEWKVSNAIRYLQAYEQAHDELIGMAETDKLLLQCNLLHKHATGRYVVVLRFSYAQGEYMVTGLYAYRYLTSAERPYNFFGTNIH